MRMSVPPLGAVNIGKSRIYAVKGLDQPVILSPKYPAAHNVSRKGSELFRSMSDELIAFKNVRNL